MKFGEEHQLGGGQVASMARSLSRTTSGNLWKVRTGKSPVLVLGFVRDVIVVIRGIVDELDKLHSHDDGALHHGIIKPQNILLFSPKYDEFGTLKLAGMGSAQQHEITTRV
jgi:hypothetical protein